MKKTFFVILVSTFIFFACDNDDMKEDAPENIFAGKAWEYKSYDGDILAVYKKISFTKNEFTVYEKYDFTNTTGAPVSEKTITGTYSLFFEEIPSADPNITYAPGAYMNITSDDSQMNGIVSWTLYNDCIHFFNKSGDCSRITTEAVNSPYNKFAPVD